MVSIPAGRFPLGSPTGGVAGPQHLVTVAAFAIDRTEVTVAAYRRCVSAGTCEPPKPGAGCNWPETDREAHPINCVDNVQAAAYCAWVGKRLPLEEEWELAAVGHNSSRYPWGNDAPAGRVCAFGVDGDISANALHTCPVGSHPFDASPYGVLDLAGSVGELTSSAYCNYPKKDHDCSFTGDRARERVIRGGRWNDGGERTVWVRSFKGITDAEPGIGFRCAR